MKNIVWILIFFTAFARAQEKNTPEIVVPVDTQKVIIPDVFNSVEVMPEYPDGINAFYKKLAENIQFPMSARLDKGFHGCKVFLKFIVDEEGFVGSFAVIKSCAGCYACDEEAIMGVKKCGRWKPGTQNGKPVKVYYTLPVSFKKQ